MSVTSSPEPMELGPAPAPAILPSDLSVEWPIEEDPELIFSLQVNVPGREPARTKVLGLGTEDQLTVGENIRQHSSYSEGEILYKTNSIKSHQVTSTHRCNTMNLSLFTQTNPPQQPTENSAHKNVHVPHPTLPKAPSIEQNRAILHSNDSNQLCYQPDPTTDNMATIELNNSTRDVSQEVPFDSEQKDENVSKRVSSPVFTNGSQHHKQDNPMALLSDPNDRFVATQSLDTPPLSSSTPEESSADPFTDPPPLHQENGSPSQLKSHENGSEGQEQVCPEEQPNSKQPISEVSQTEIENKNPNFDLETPPNDPPLQDHFCTALPTDISGEEQTRVAGVDTCPDPETPGCELPPDSSTNEKAFDEENESLTPTHITEVETFSMSMQDNPCTEKVDTSALLTSSLPSTLKGCIYQPPLELRTSLHMKRCKHIINMQQLLQEKSRELQAVIGQMEKKLLIHQSSTFLTFARDKRSLQLTSASSLTHSRLLKQTPARELEKQARFFKATLKNCTDMHTGYETESSSDNECYQNSTNLGGPKRRRLTKIHRNWLNDRCEIGARWNWLDLQISQIESELSSVNQRLEELNSSRVPDQGLPSETVSRCIPYTHSPSLSRVIHKAISLRTDSMSNILQSSPHYHSILSLRDNIPSTLLLHDSLMSIPNKKLPFDPKDLKKMEQTITHNKSLSATQFRKAVNSTSKKIGHRPKLNSSSVSHRFGSVSVAEMSRNKTGKNKPLLSSGGTRHRRARSYDTTSIIIPGSSLPRQEKPSFKEIVIPGWREFIGAEDASPREDYDSEDSTDSTYEVLHSKFELAEKQNYQDAMHYSSSSKKLKRLQTNPDSPKPYNASYGWSLRKFPLFSDDFDFEEMTNRSRKTTESTSPIEDSVFSTSHVASLSTTAQL